MSATDPQSSHLSNPRSSQSNIQYGDNNRGNLGIIGNGFGNTVVNNLNAVPLHELLRVSTDALHDSSNAPLECHPGTRINSCDSIKEWMSDPKGSPLLWLHGPAGVGKSTIAKTISTIQDQVVATFFFSTSSNKSGDTLFPTLAWQLAKNVPQTEEHIVAALKRNPLLTNSELKQQFDQLIVQPLKECTSVTAPLVMVIDGVDECINEIKQKEFLKILKCAGKKGCWPLRFLICSRPESGIHTILEDGDHATAEPQGTNSPNSDISQNPHTVGPANTGQSTNPIDSAQEQQSLTVRDRVLIKIWRYFSMAKTWPKSSRQWDRRFTVLPLDARMLCQPTRLGVDKSHLPTDIHDIPDKLSPRPVVSRIQIWFSDDDIRTYLTDQFKAICQSEIASEDIEALVKISCGQFIYASTIARLLDTNSKWNPKDVLKMVDSNSRSSDLNKVDKLYSAILNEAHNDIKAETDRVTLRDVFAILIILWENVQLANIPESFPIIESLLLLESAELEWILRKMHSILDIKGRTSIHAYHRSFFEFLQHRDRSEHHYITYPLALRRYLFFLSRVVLRYQFRRYYSQLRDYDEKQAARIQNMVLAFPQLFQTIS